MRSFDSDYAVALAVVDKKDIAHQPLASVCMSRSWQVDNRLDDSPSLGLDIVRSSFGKK